MGQPDGLKHERYGPACGAAVRTRVHEHIRHAILELVDDRLDLRAAAFGASSRSLFSWSAQSPYKPIANHIIAMS
ncbi:MAG: hypothetical protein ABJE66_18945 [Deltaproteobacteria bacterium]